MADSTPAPALPHTPRRNTASQVNSKHVSFNSTPSKNNAVDQIHLPDGSASTRKHDDYIKRQYTERTSWDIPLSKFLKGVFRVSSLGMCPAPYGADSENKDKPYYILRGEEIQAYRSSSELRSYDPLVNLMNDALKQLYGPLGTNGSLDGVTAADRAAVRERRKQVIQLRCGGSEDVQCADAVGLKEKPDLSYGTSGGKRPWEFTLVPIEVGKDVEKFKEGKTLSDILISAQNGLFSVVQSVALEVEEVVDVNVTGSEPVPAPADEQAQVQTRTEGSSRATGSRGTGPSESGSNSGKRKRDAVGESTASGSKRLRTEAKSKKDRGLSGKEVQALRYVNDVMSSNVRSYVVGWLIEDTKLRLVYGDRMGAAFSERIEFLGRRAHDFLSIVRAMGGASVHDLGILPNMHFPRHEEDGLVYETFVESKGYDGATFHLDIPIDQAPGSSGETHEQAGETLVFAVRSSGKVKTEFGGIGRGTTVFASSPQNERAKQVCKEDDLVAKVAWPHKVRAAEDATIRRIRHCLELAGMGRYLPHIVDLKCSSTRTIEEMHLPRLEMGLALDEADVRVCRTLILKRYERLETIGSRDRFHTVFVDAVRAHHWVYETSKILHRDISINNIMWYAKDDGKVLGVLCDWDLAADYSNGELRATHGPREPDTTSQAGADKSKPGTKNRHTEQGETDQSAAQLQVPVKAAYRTGTGPFMAMDLLRPGLPPLHKYRHDLESFLYVYIYTAAGYSPNTQSIGVVAQWQDESLINVGRRKRELFNDPKEFKNILARAHEEFQPLNEPGSFLFRLLSIFRAVEKGFDRVKDIEWSMEQFGDQSEDQLLEMERIEKERDDGVTYSKLMEILKEKEDV